MIYILLYIWAYLFGHIFTWNKIRLFFFFFLRIKVDRTVRLRTSAQLFESVIKLLRAPEVSRTHLTPASRAESKVSFPLYYTSSISFLDP